MPQALAVPKSLDPVTDESITFNKTFYLPDSAGDLVFKVDGGYYKVHRHLLERESSVMFGFPSPSEGQDGESNEKPINIPGVINSEFEALFSYLYDRFMVKAVVDAGYLTSTPKEEIRKEKSEKALFNLLLISLRFECEQITEFVLVLIDHLDKFCPLFHDYMSTTGDLQPAIWQ